MPVVNIETIDALVSRYKGRTSDWGNYLEEVRARMIRENPEFVRYSNILLSNFDPQIRDEVATVVVEIYAAIESQISNNLIGKTIEKEK